MTAEERLRLAEDLLLGEVDLLERYNRLLERLGDPTLADLLRQIRDEQVRRINLFQNRIQHIRSTLEA